MLNGTCRATPDSKEKFAIYPYTSSSCRSALDLMRNFYTLSLGDVAVRNRIDIDPCAGIVPSLSSSTD